jgi:hypothetical protein
VQFNSPVITRQIKGFGIYQSYLKLELFALAKGLFIGVPSKKQGGAHSP